MTRWASAEFGDEARTALLELCPLEFEPSDERLEPSNIAGRLSGIGSIDRVPTHHGITLGVVVEMLVVDQLLASQRELLLDLTKPIADSEQLAFTP